MVPDANVGNYGYGKFDSWTIIDDNTAVKQLDKWFVKEYKDRKSVV